ncbi:CAF17-like 4Fe-4S cluster assembly/insertion protein YgfZ [Spiribacter salinus]|uniref:CAF17-like 4Fe-4S cluster assembly/insertion protein YgfZ n=1 Tax=Spiribacter salinus TaxID=1335746 RepID=UPI001C97839F|nr:folate-binding protein [Spiribacter salinus]MBY5268443.1 hypothetical protein [Spiribacter salinus]
MSGVWADLLADHTVTDAPLADPETLATAAKDSGVVAPLPSLAALHVAGADARDFLHSQLTQSITDLADDETRLAAWCNAKGRARAIVRVVPSDTGLVLLGHAETVHQIRPKLQMFVLRAQVALTDLSESEALLGMAGPTAETLLSEAVGTLPRVAGGLIRAGDLHVIAVPAAEGLRYMLLAPAEQMQALWVRYTEALTQGDERFWQWMDIQAGMPDITPATQEAFVPTMLNLEPLGGISYDKGCYPGQEVVARMHYLGSLKRRLYRGALPADPPAPGTPITRADGSEAGTVVSAAQAPAGGSELLAVLRIEAASDAALAVDDWPLALLELPYAPPA